MRINEMDDIKQKWVKYLVEQGYDHPNIRMSVKYEVLQECRIKLETMLNGKVGFSENKYLKMEILLRCMP